MPPKRPATSQTPDHMQQANGEGSFANGDEFTHVVRKRLSTSTRTGQACDRCKVRKIRCDGLRGGCSPCIQNRTECKTTDRISQKAVPRGYLENLEAKCQDLESKNKELQAALIAMEATNRVASNGFAPFESADWSVNSAKPQPSTAARLSYGERWKIGDRADMNAYPPMNGGGGPTMMGKSLSSTGRGASFRPGTANTHYLGMSAGNSYLSSMKAIALSLLGIDIDLSALDPSEPAGHASANQTDESYGSCLSTIFNVNPNVPKAELPPKEEGMQYINYFFIISHPYLPILHIPSFINMAERIYNDKNFEPTAAQIVQLHMVFAIVHFQNAAHDRMKNRGQISQSAREVMERSRRHYHYAVSLMYELFASSSLEDLQAIGLILQHLRAFPKPGGSWLLSRLAISMCVELGLHRSAKKWIYSGAKLNYIEVEMRKRVFWCILALEASLASKLGRPMSMRVGDWDVEYPERVDDEYIVESEILKREDGVEECKFDVAIQMFKHATLTVQIHSTLYSVQTPSRDQYVSLVEDIEGKLIRWRDQWPKSLSLDSPKPARQFHAAHLTSWYHESRILMRHPSLSLSPSPSFTSDCIRICVDSSREILHLTDNLRKGNHYLDTTWYGATVQLLATLTILFSVWNKRDSVTTEELAQVKKDMDLCMDIMGDLGSLLGSPNRLRDIVHVLTVGTMELLTKKPENSNPKRSPLLPNTYYAPSHHPLPQQQQQMTEYHPVYAPVYTDPSLPAQPEYDSAVTGVGANFHTYPDATTNPAAAAAAGSSTQQQQWGWSGNESWREYMHNISSIAESLDPSETYASSALMALGQDVGGGLPGNPAAAAAAAAAAAVAAVQHQHQHQQQQGGSGASEWGFVAGGGQGGFTGFGEVGREGTGQ